MQLNPNLPLPPFPSISRWRLCPRREIRISQARARRKVSPLVRKGGGEGRGRRDTRLAAAESAKVSSGRNYRVFPGDTAREADARLLDRYFQHGRRRRDLERESACTA